MVRNVGFRRCVKTAEVKTNTKRERLTEKQEAATMVAQWDRKNIGQKHAPQWKTGRKEKLHQTQTQKLKAAMDTKTEQFKQIAPEAKEAKTEKLLWRTQCWNNADTSGISTNKWKGMIVPKQPQTLKTQTG